MIIKYVDWTWQRIEIECLETRGKQPLNNKGRMPNKLQKS